MSRASIAVLPLLLVGGLLGGCGGSPAPASGGGPVGTLPAATGPVTADPTDLPSVDANAACRALKATTAAIITRVTVPGSPAAASKLDAGWFWDDTSRRCVTNIDMALGSLPPGPNYCVEVAPAADNPGYDLTARPAPPLKNVVKHVGDACAEAPN